jgi:hypothetical protein
VAAGEQVGEPGRHGQHREVAGRQFFNPHPAARSRAAVATIGSPAGLSVQEM